MVDFVNNNYILKFHDDFYTPIMDFVKVSTIRDEPKPINKGDLIEVCFKPSERLRTVRILNHYAIKFHDLTDDIAKKEGYLHRDLLKHELLNIYPELKPDDYIYIYEFIANIKVKDKTEWGSNQHKDIKNNNEYLR